MADTRTPEQKAAYDRGYLDERASSSAQAPKSYGPDLIDHYLDGRSHGLSDSISAAENAAIAEHERRNPVFAARIDPEF